MAQSSQPTAQFHVGKLPALCRETSTPTSRASDLHVPRGGKSWLKRLVRENRRQASVRVATRSRTSSCYAGDIRDIPWCAATSTLPRHAAGVTGRYEALGTTSPHHAGGGRPVRARARLPAPRRSGAGWDDRANRREPLLNVVRSQQAKGAERLEPKGTWPVAMFLHHCPQMERHRRTGGAYLIQGTRAERGKPVSLPAGKVSRKASGEGCG